MFTVTIARVAETLNSVIDQMTYGRDLTHVNLLGGENMNLAYKDLNASSDKQAKQWIIDHVLYDILTSWAKRSSNGQLSYWLWSIGIFNKSYWLGPNIMWASKLRSVHELNSNFKWQHCRHPIYTRCGVTARCGRIHVCPKIQLMILGRKRMVWRHRNLFRRVWWKLSRLKTQNHKCMAHASW